MPHKAFHRRASALESEFFHRADQELIEKLHEHNVLEVDEDALTIATGISDTSVLDELLRMQITSKTLLAFSLFPAIYVAWADGDVEAAEREAILSSAMQQGVSPGSPAYELLQSWLHDKPGPDLFRAWEDFIHAVRPTLTVKGFQELHDNVISRARTVAESAGGILGIHKVTAGETAAIDELDAVFVNALDEV